MVMNAFHDVSAVFWRTWVANMGVDKRWISSSASQRASLPATAMVPWSCTGKARRNIWRTIEAGINHFMRDANRAFADVCAMPRCLIITAVSTASDRNAGIKLKSSTDFGAKINEKS